MKKLYLFLVGFIVFILWSGGFSYAVTVGNPLDLDIPPRSAILRQQAVDHALDEYEEAVKINAALDIELMFDKDLHTSNELNGAKIEGLSQMLKLGVTVFNRVEPYLKIGTSDLKATWKCGSREMEVDADSSFAWGGGLKVVVWEFEDMGLRITADGQYRTLDADVKGCSIDKMTIKDEGPKFEIDEWQVSLLASKKFEIPLRWGNSLYMVPYTGMTVSDSNADVKFNDPANREADYTLYDANNDSMIGFVAGLDIVPSLKSSFIYNIEVRLVNEAALSLGGAMKF